MNGFRITKYNPIFRLPDGSYSRAEWTSVCDIGNMYDDGVLELEKYLRTENDYINAVQSFMTSEGISSLYVVDLEKNENYGASFPSFLLEETKYYTSLLFEGIELNGQFLEWVIKIALRKKVWCRMEGPDGFYVHFGYDYYMYIGSEKMKPAPPVLPAGIFAEPFESPYHREEN
jgi:hypothetical protein